MKRGRKPNPLKANVLTRNEVVKTNMKRGRKPNPFKVKVQTRNEVVETLKSLDFGAEDNPIQCYRAQAIKIGGVPYFGITKCIRNKCCAYYTPTRKSIYMPTNAWNSFIQDIAPQMSVPPVYQRQLGLDESTRYLF